MSKPPRLMSTQPTFDKAVLEEIASFFVDRLGGTKYVLGVETVVGSGDLSGRNFARRAGLRNEQKTHPRSIFPLAARQLTMAPNTTYTLSIALPTPIIGLPDWKLELWAYSYGWAAGTCAASGETITLKRNTTNLASPAFGTLTGPVRNVATLSTPVQLVYGDTLQFVFSRGATGTLTDVVFEAFLRAKHIR